MSKAEVLQQWRLLGAGSRRSTVRVAAPPRTFMALQAVLQFQALREVAASQAARTQPGPELSIPRPPEHSFRVARGVGGVKSLVIALLLDLGLLRLSSWGYVS